MLAIMIAFLLSGCGFWHPGTSLGNITTSSISKHASGGVFICDIVAIFDTKLAKQFSKMKAEDYYKTIGNLSALYQDQLSIWRLEQLPNTQQQTVSLQWRKNPCIAKMLMLFADYRTKGEHEFIIKPSTQEIKVIFDQTHIAQVKQYTKKIHTAHKSIRPKPYTESINLS